LKKVLLLIEIYVYAFDLPLNDSYHKKDFDIPLKKCKNRYLFVFTHNRSLLLTNCVFKYL